MKNNNKEVNGFVAVWIKCSFSDNSERFFFLKKDVNLHNATLFSKKHNNDK